MLRKEWEDLSLIPALHSEGSCWSGEKLPDSPLGSFLSIPDRAKVVRGLPDVATIMEDKVSFFPTHSQISTCLYSLEDPSGVTIEWSAVDSRAKGDRLTGKVGPTTAGQVAQ